MPQDSYASARAVNIILGIWLFISAFIWRHSYAQMTNTWIVGVLAVAFALISTKVPEARYLNAVLAVWLFLANWALPTISAGTQWNNALVAIAMFVASLAPAYLGGRGQRPLTRT